MTAKDKGISILNNAPHRRKSGSDATKKRRKNIVKRTDTNKSEGDLYLNGREQGQRRTKE